MSTSRHIQPTWAGEAPPPARRPTDVVDTSGVLAERLRRALGFRVDGPEGRIGTLRALVPGDLGAEPRLRVDVGLFVRREIGIPLATVREIDAERRRVLVDTVPKIPRRARAEVARCVRRFVHASGAVVDP